MQTKATFHKSLENSSVTKILLGVGNVFNLCMKICFLSVILSCFFKCIVTLLEADGIVPENDP
jgi:hypothetical protein